MGLITAILTFETEKVLKKNDFNSLTLSIGMFLLSFSSDLVKL